MFVVEDDVEELFFAWIRPFVVVAQGVVWFVDVVSGVVYRYGLVSDLCASSVVAVDVDGAVFEYCFDGVSPCVRRHRNSWSCRSRWSRWKS